MEVSTKAAPNAGGPGVFSERPVLVFWETTRACLLSCVHCRASAIKEPLPGELTTEEGRRLLDQITSFGRPAPTVIFTGGDPLTRQDLFELMAYAKELGLKFGVSPAVTELLTRGVLVRIRDAGASAVSLSLDGATAATHDSIRRREFTYERTIRAMSDALSLGLNVQVNTAVMKRSYKELPDIFHLIRALGISTWELFFLVRVGRGSDQDDLTPAEYETVCNLLYDASFRGMTIRSVEAPFLRRVARQRSLLGDYWRDRGYQELRAKLFQTDGEQSGNSSLGHRGTLDGDGIVFVGYEGAIHPGGLLPIDIGNVRQDDLVRTYRESSLLRDIRDRNLHGPCGVCEFKEICGGSRARAYAYYKDALSTDPACLYAAKYS